MLTCRLESRIFQGKTVQDLVGEVFASFGSLAKCEFRLNKSLKLYSYCNPERSPFVPLTIVSRAISFR